MVVALIIPSNLTSPLTFNGYAGSSSPTVILSLFERKFTNASGSLTRICSVESLHLKFKSLFPRFKSKSLSSQKSYLDLAFLASSGRYLLAETSICEYSFAMKSFKDGTMIFFSPFSSFTDGIGQKRSARHFSISKA